MNQSLINTSNIMVLSIQIEYRTNWGEELRILGSTPELGNGDVAQACPLSTADGISWNLTQQIKELPSKSFEYNYYVFKDGKPVRKEWNLCPRTIIFNKNRTFYCTDVWKDMPPQEFFFTSAFTDCWLKRKYSAPERYNYKKSIIIKALSPRIGNNYALGIIGNQETLGNWNLSKSLKMNEYSFNRWEIELDASQISYPMEYKFVLYNLKEKRIAVWETSSNRILSDPKITENESIVISDCYAYFDLPDWKCAGTAIPVFSLRSKESFGIGDFNDLKKMIDWVKITGQKILQILPINDTTITHTWTDSYPYSSISIYAFHPLYISLKELGTLKDKAQILFFNKKQEEINYLETVDYESVSEIKWKYFREIFKQEGKKILASKSFEHYFADNKEWLQPYALFSVLRDEYHTANFHEWKILSKYNKKQAVELCKPKSKYYSEISLIYFLQYNLQKQLQDASDYAKEKGIVLKGDIPIGINRNSCEAWTEPHYFNFNGQAGAPPDDFSVNGQNWGFPTYNWDEMEKDGYQWWMKRFQKMSQYFQAYRIDHILGFFRIWEIPRNAVHGLLGQFSPSLPLSKEEIEYNGLYFQEDLFTKPYIREYFLKDLFGPHTEEVKHSFLNNTNQYECFEMKPNFDTQKKVEAYFETKTDADSIWIRDGLYALISDVLFIRDHKDPYLYHPRISVQFDYVYQSLSQPDKEAFNRIYDNYYYHRHNDFWANQAMKKLPKLVQSTRMLVCGEDLGMIPPCVEWIMNQLQILSLEIQRMSKIPMQEFGWPGDYPRRSVCTVSSHDTSTLRGWWREDKDRTQRYYSNVLKREGQAPEDATEDICTQVIKEHLYSKSALCILTFQDWLSIDKNWRNSNIEGERINVPANPKHYWRYRMHLTLEDMMKADDINQKIRELIKKTDRDSEF